VKAQCIPRQGGRVATRGWGWSRVAGACLLAGLLAGCAGGGGSGSGGGNANNSGNLEGTNTVVDDRTTGPDGTGSVGHVEVIPPRPPAEDQTYF
jgi:hypothetical protein